MGLDYSQFLSTMSLEEKIAQITGVDAAKLLDEEKRFSPEKATQWLQHGIGTVGGLAYSSDAMPEDVLALSGQIRDWIMDHTRLKIPPMFHEECLCGLAGRGAPIFPVPLGLGSMWEPGLVRRMSESIRELMAAMGAHQALSPVMDICTDHRFGRNEEMYGEDAMLVAANACDFVEGLQGDDLAKGIAATAKHFAGHGQCEGGRNCSPVHMGMRELRDGPLLPFEAAVRQANIRSIMNAYQDIDGVPCAASREMLTGILREEWGFTGTVVSDYGAVERLISQHFTAGSKPEAARQALEAGLDVELPYAECFATLAVEVRSGRMDETLVDRALLRVLALKQELGLLDGRGQLGDPAALRQSQETAALAAEMARKSMVLLKNDGLLPLDRPALKTIAVIGPNAHSRRSLVGDYSYLSLSANRLKLPDVEAVAEEVAGRAIPTVLEAITGRVREGLEVRHAQGCTLKDNDDSGIAEAVEAARGADVAILVVGDRSAMWENGTAGENIDRVSLELYGAQPELVRAVAATGTPVVLVLMGGRPLVLTEPVGLCNAVLEAWVPGEQGAAAIADVLFGACNPAGRLPVSLLRHQGQHPLPYQMRKINHHKQYMDCTMEPLFPFGHGLSYSSFTYSNLTVSAPPQGRGEVLVTVSVGNAGSRDGDEVVQLYMCDDVASIARPAKELKGFLRVSLAAGETKTLRFALHTDQLAFRNRAMELAVEPGRFTVMAGASSADIRLTGPFELVAGYAVGSDRVYFCHAAVLED